jgi:hypothetical protein
MRDADVRASVLKMLTEQHAGDTGTRIVEEMGIWSGSVRIDVAVINGELIGYELKSDRDTLDRLPLQKKLFSRVFDRVVLVVGQKHVRSARAKVPRWWGITVASPDESGVSLLPKRLPQLNPSIDAYLVAQLLWRDEAIALLEAKHLAKGWKTKRVKELHQRLAVELSLSELTSHVRETLKARTGWLKQSSTD